MYVLLTGGNTRFQEYESGSIDNNAIYFGHVSFHSIFPFSISTLRVQWMVSMEVGFYIHTDLVNQINTKLFFWIYQFEIFNSLYLTLCLDCFVACSITSATEEISLFDGKLNFLSSSKSESSEFSSLLSLSFPKTNKLT